MMIKGVKLLEKGTTSLLGQYETEPFNSWAWKKGPSVRRLKYEIKIGLHEWVGSLDDRPQWWD
jgi:hypothetical protein